MGCGALEARQQGFWEGCLSVPGLRGFVHRPRKVKITFLNDRAQQEELILEGFLATVFQHELDHLNGITFNKRVSKLKWDMALKRRDKKDA